MASRGARTEVEAKGNEVKLRADPHMKTTVPKIQVGDLEGSISGWSTASLPSASSFSIAATSRLCIPRLAGGSGGGGGDY